MNKSQSRSDEERDRFQESIDEVRRVANLIEETQPQWCMHLRRVLVLAHMERLNEKPVSERGTSEGWIKGEPSMKPEYPSTITQAQDDRHTYFLAANGLYYHFPPKGKRSERNGRT